MKIQFKFLWYDTETTGTNTQATVKFIISLTEVMPGNYYAQQLLSSGFTQQELWT